MIKKIITAQKRVLKILSGKVNDFYLGGGTALSNFYFNHRESFDLDFFTKDFNKKRISQVIDYISISLKKKNELIAEENRKSRVKIQIFRLDIDKKNSLKIDFIQDYIRCLKPTNSFNGINILSLEDIYLRKIYAISGTQVDKDAIGRRNFLGHRQEAKDFYDMYCLSQIFMRLSDFAFRYGSQLIRESLIRWFRTYDRLEIKSGLLDLAVKKKIDYSEIEMHFKNEIDRIITKEIGIK